MPQSLIRMDKVSKTIFSKENIIDSVAGLRPCRHGGPRMELEEWRDKLVGHNYGHGGSGITLCWGAARLIVEKLQQQVPSGPVAVLGAGVIGLCTGALLQDAGYQVRIYAEAFPPNTTSNIAGGLWAPTHVGTFPDELLTWSWQKFTELLGEEYGVYRVKLYETDGCPHPLDPLPKWLVGEEESLERLPLSSKSPPGRAWNTYLIETDHFLERLCKDIKERGGQLIEQGFSDPSELERLEEPVLMNCLGLGAGRLFEDPAVYPIRGQLLYLKPVGQRFILDHPGGYIISRGDKLVLGGTFEEGVYDTESSEVTAEAILEGNRSFPWD